MSKTDVSSSKTKNRPNYEDMSDELSCTSSNEEEVLPKAAKSKKLQPTDASDYDDGLYDRGSRRRRKRARRSRSRRKRSRSRSRRRR